MAVKTKTCGLNWPFRISNIRESCTILKERPSTVLVWRLFSSAIIISSLVAAIVFDLRWGREEDLARPGILTVVIVSTLAILASLELDRLTSQFRQWGRRLTRIAATTLVVATAAIPVFYVPYPPDCPVGRLGWPVVGALIGLLLLFGREMLLFRSDDAAEINAQPSGINVGPATTRLGIGALSMVYVGLPLAMIINVRLLSTNAFGMWALLSLIVIPKAADAGAYFTGHAIGKHKLVPRLSPGKTIEGFAGGLATGVVSSLLLWYVIGPYVFATTIPGSWLAAVAYGLILSLVSVFGDLCESLIKRDCQIKDSSHLLPGLGGVLDVIDSILTSAPAAYAFWIIMDL